MDIHMASQSWPHGSTYAFESHFVRARKTMSKQFGGFFSYECIHDMTDSLELFLSSFPSDFDSQVDLV